MAHFKIGNLDRRQVDELHGLFLHCWEVKHQGSDPDYTFRAEILDELNVPWSIQNWVAEYAQVRTNIHRQFSSILMEILYKTQQNVSIN